MDNPEVSLLEPQEDTTFSKLALSQKFRYSRQILFDSVPTIAAYIIPIFTNLISLTFLTNYHDDTLVGGYGLGMTFIAVVGTAWIFCFNHASNIYISQAFGAKDYPACGRFLRRNITISLPLLIPISLLLAFSDKIMMLFGVPEDLATNACIFTRLSIPFLVGVCCFDSMRSFIMGQGVFHPIIYIQAITLILHVVWANLFINYLHLGIYGAAICRTLEEWTNTAIIYIYIRKCGKFDHTWGSWANVFDWGELWKQFKFALTIAGVGYLEWFYYEVLTIIAGTFGAQQTVVHVALSNTAALSFTTTLGISMTITVFVGISLGKKNILRAKNYTYAGYYLLFFIDVCFVILLFALRNLWVAWWSADPSTRLELEHTVPLFNFVFLLVDGLNTGIVSVLKCIGKQKWALIRLVVILYVLGIPLVLVFSTVLGMKVYGIWLGFTILKVLLLLGNTISLWRVDWNEVLIKVTEKHKPVETEEKAQLTQE